MTFNPSCKHITKLLNSGYYIIHYNLYDKNLLVLDFS